MIGCGSLAKRASKAALAAGARPRSSLGDGRSAGLLSRWHQLAERELSLLDDVAQRFAAALPTLSPSALSQMARDGEREFWGSGTGPRADQQERASDKSGAPKAAAAAAGSAYSSYSFSYSAILDEGGERVLASSKRRRYEDSTGRIKARHERTVDGGAKKLTSTWTRAGGEEEGPRCTTELEGCGSEEEFEQSWARTAFADGQTGGETPRHDGLGYGSSPPEARPQGAEGPGDDARPFGADEDAARAAPAKETSEFADGVTEEAHNKSREDAIAEGSRTQEEETTPPP